MKKGQFMAITAVLIGLTILATAALIADFQTSAPESVDEGYYLQNAINEIENTNTSNLRDIKVLEKTLESQKGYRANLSYWENNQEDECLQIELASSNSQLNINCVEITTLDAQFTYNDTEPSPGDTIEFTDETLTAPDTNVDTSEWFIDGESEETGSEFEHEFDESGEYEIKLEVETQGGDEDTEIRYLRVGQLNIASLDEESPVVEGEESEIIVTVENQQDEPISEELEIEILDGGDTVYEDSRGVDLAPGESQDVVFEWQTQVGDAQDDLYDLEATFRESFEEGQIDVIDEAYFSVSITDNYDETVIEGETLEVEADIENEGADEDTQTIDFDLGNEEDVTLEPEEIETVVLEWETEEGDAGEYTATIESEDESDSVEVEVEEPSDFQVEIIDYNEPEEGETLEVDVEVENDGSQQDIQDVQIAVENGAEFTDDDEVNLDPDDSEILEFSWETEVGDSGDYVAVAESEDDQDEESLTIQEADAELLVSIINTNDPVYSGETVVFDIELENNDQVSVNQDIELDIEEISGIQDSKEIELDSGESQMIELEWDTTVDQHGEFTGIVSSEDDSDEQIIEVEESDDEFMVQIMDTNDPVEPGQNLEVEVEVENEGQLDGTQDIILEREDGADMVQEDSQELELNEGESEQLTLTWETDEETNDGDYEIKVETEDDQAEDQVTIETEGFLVNIEETNDPVEPGEILEVETEIENNQEEEDTQIIEFLVEEGTEYSDSQEITLNDGESQLINFEWPTDDEQEEDTYEVSTESEDDSDQELVDVQEDVETFDVAYVPAWFHEDREREREYDEVVDSTFAEFQNEVTSQMDINENQIEREVVQTGECDQDLECEVGVDGECRDDAYDMCVGDDKPLDQEDFDLIHVLCDNDELNDLCGGNVAGVASLGGEDAASVYFNDTDLILNEVEETFVHEIGHNFNLRHVHNEELLEDGWEWGDTFDDLQEPPIDECSLPGQYYEPFGGGEDDWELVDWDGDGFGFPNEPDKGEGSDAINFYMPYCAGLSEEFGPAAVEHIENEELNEYID